ncbi:hypothetical protein [Rhodococcus erythropolis]|uniref:hypothetical protein n=1 Tax=Rhodococcus erythropolis TaxID=1833 RepID=UPI001BEA5E35|nr:hypothetical protein [Rhodococcus erythropolis]MBT2266065.1 hypothetical protein [Rhodococcus erythropolis]
MAGATPGFGLLPGDSARYISSRNSEIDTTGNTVIEVTWCGDKRRMFFEDGPIFVLRDDTPTEVVARYRNGRVAAVAADFGRGRVGVVGPHPETDQSWYTNGLTKRDLGTRARNTEAWMQHRRVGSCVVVGCDAAT